MKHRLWVSSVSVLAMVWGLNACAPLMVAGMAGSALVATDRRTSGTQLEDETIEFRGSARVRDMFGEKVHVNITSFNRQVLLTGEVPTERDRQTIVGMVEKLENVKSVVNELAVMPVTSVSSRSGDLVVTGDITAAGTISGGGS